MSQLVHGFCGVELSSFLTVPCQGWTLLAVTAQPQQDVQGEKKPAQLWGPATRVTIHSQ